MWTELDLFKECARSAKQQVLDQHVHAAVWSAINAWLVQQFASHRGAGIAAFGRLTWQRCAARPSAPEGASPQLRPVFIPADSYLRTHALHHASSATRAITVQLEELAPCEEYDGLRVALKFSRSLTRAVVEGCTRRLLAALGEAVRSGRQVAVDMGVGTLTGRDRALGFEFLPSYLAAHRTVAGSSRPGAWASAALGARRTARQQQHQQQKVQVQTPQTRREELLAGLAQLQAELEEEEAGGDQADEGAGDAGGPDQVSPGVQLKRWPRRESLPGQEARGRLQKQAQRRAVSQPRRPSSPGPDERGRRGCHDTRPDTACRPRRDTSPGPQERPSWGRRVPPARAHSPGRQAAAASRPSSPGPSERSRPVSSGTRGRGAVVIGRQEISSSAGPTRCTSPGPARRGASAAGTARPQAQERTRRPSSPGPGLRPNASSNKTSDANGLSVGFTSCCSKSGEWWSAGEHSGMEDSSDMGGQPFSPTPAERAAAEAVPVASHIQLAARAPRSRPVSPPPPMCRPASAPRARVRAAANAAVSAAGAAGSRHSDSNTGTPRASSTPRNRPVSAGAQNLGATKVPAAPSRSTSPGPVREQRPLSAARAQALAVLRGRSASPRCAAPAQPIKTGPAAPDPAPESVAAQPKPRVQQDALELWSPDNSLRSAAGRRAAGAAAQAQRRTAASGATAGGKDASDTAPWLRPRNQCAAQQCTAEPAAPQGTALVQSRSGQAPEGAMRRVSCDGGNEGTSGDIGVEDQHALRSARKPLFMSPPGRKLPPAAGTDRATKSRRDASAQHGQLLPGDARTGKSGGADATMLASSADADDCMASQPGREWRPDQTGAFDRSRSPSPGPRPGSRGVVVTLAAVRSASPGPNMRYGSGPAAADGPSVSTAALSKPLDTTCKQAAHEVAGGRVPFARLVGSGKAAVEDQPLCLAKAAAAGPASPPRMCNDALQQHQQQLAKSYLAHAADDSTVAAVDVAAAATGFLSLQRPAMLGRRAGRGAPGHDAGVAESWELELEAELEDVEDLLEGVEQCLGSSGTDLLDTQQHKQSDDGHGCGGSSSKLGHGFEEAGGGGGGGNARRVSRPGGNSSAGGCTEEWSSSGMACSSSATSCFSFGRGGASLALNGSSLRAGHGVGGVGVDGPPRMAAPVASTSQGIALATCQEESDGDGVPAGKCGSLQMPPQCTQSPTRRCASISASEDGDDAAPAAAQQGWRSPGWRHCGDGSSSTGTINSSRGLRGRSLAVREEDLPGPAWGSRRPPPAHNQGAPWPQQEQRWRQTEDAQEEGNEEEEDWSDDGDGELPEVQRYIKMVQQAAAQRQWQHSSDESEVE